MSSIPIRYISTQRSRSSGRAREPVSFREALQCGLAPDGGLYLPETLPKLEEAGLEALRDASYARVAFTLLKPFVEGAIAEDDFLRLCEEAYDFETPMEPVEKGVWILRLDRGPTASFKDYAARWMARMMRALLPPGTVQTLLVATSGDTGSAVGEAFRGIHGFQVVLLYPEREVSPVQKLQLDHIGCNVRALSVAGTFDDCQALVKRAFLDPDLAGLNLTSANSINIGRILPQCVYYVYAWLRVSRRNGPVTFVVPSGNFGNSFGCELARRMGLPVTRLILAVNANEEFPLFLESGKYQPLRPSRACLSNAMNVGNPSNLARFFDVYGGWVTPEGVVRKDPDLTAMRRTLASVSISDEETVACIRDTWLRNRVLLDPHGAVGVAAWRKSGQGELPAVCLETAHPAKFPEVIQQTLGFTPNPPAALCLANDRPAAVENLPARYEALRETLIRTA